MKRLFWALPVFFLFACGAPPEKVPPFIFVTLKDPEGFVAPFADTLQINNRAIVNGNLIEKNFEAELLSGLPTSFSFSFSEGIRGNVVDVTIVGLVGGQPVFLATESVVADVSIIEMTARFCGDVVVDEDRSEECDDGPSNSDTLPGACRTSCLLAFCGDSVIDAGEQCDDGPNNSDTIPGACRTSCVPSSCGDGAVDPGEECDDGLQNSDLLADACRTDCTLAGCGDAVTDSIEECDDSNAINNDGCDNDCATSKVVQLALGLNHTCALLRLGDVRCWGVNSSGQLGYGNTIDIGDNEFPKVAGDVNIGGVATQVTAGGDHTCVLLDTGNVRCWGDNDFGQLGYGNILDIGDNETPNAVGTVNIGGSVVQIDAGFDHTCALLNTGKVRCWGRGTLGRLGYGNSNNIGDTETPNVAGDINVGGIVVQISSGSEHTCALLNTGTVRCWGLGLFGRLGYQNTNVIGDNEIPAAAGDVSVAGGEDVIQIQAGNLHTCALLSSADVRCWGFANSGSLGYGNTNIIGDNESPFSAGDVNVGGTVVQISIESNSCSLLNDGKARCWGNGILGYSNSTVIGDDETPSVAGDLDLGGAVLALEMGSAHACAILTTGQAKCWGRGLFGRLGYGNEVDIGDNETPAAVGEVPLF
jgi:cysteine-rich repeat protein